MSTQSIQSQDIKISEVFQGFYSVPDYQREYVWQSEQVEQLLTDIYGELNGADPEKAPEYFIGSIVVCPSKNGVFDLIDGQQRMTTLFLILCAIRDRFEVLGYKAPGALAPQIATTSSDAHGRDVFRYRLDLQYEDSGDVLVGIADKKEDPANGQKTRSIENILNAYSSVMTFLTQQYGDNPDALRVFYGYFINKVKLIRIQTEDVAKALKIFETINDRGIGLDSMDLLKNLLFMKSDQDEFEALKKVWKELQDTIFDAGEKPLRFLRYFIFSSYSVEALREDEIYGWFSKNQKVCGYADDSLKFAKELLDAAKAYGLFLKGCDPSGKQRPELQSLQFLGGSAARQHLILLLAGRHLPDVLFSQLVREVENLFFIYVASRENTRDFERNFARWAPELKKAKTEETLQLFLRQRIEPSKAALSGRFDDAFKRMTSEELQVYRLRYILAKLNQYVEVSAYGETEGTKWLKNYVANEFQIEHIQPQKPCQEALDEFGNVSDPAIINRLGNLVLVEKPINASLGNKPYSKKRLVYPQSKLLLVHSISERPKIGTNTSIDRAVRELEPFADWNEEAVISRQAKLGSMAREIWNVPNTEKK
ncbi:DUF262 domain-containing protein [Candidatus Nitrotoga arctica]|uniref:DUF262 domain-containing protein n=1 Tax=Candidatus Nitrotoga arctica TaxID=453162 RepID=A0ABN8AMI2_9PROT|nr:DUF262 domain-containing protein [Candidatus Nitrotoga arctica]CAG9933199.1 conserved protein of unknown function [Candidatus Nitrotoga arctica]